MTDKEINKYIHETIMGYCWHEPRENQVKLRLVPCKKCNEPIYADCPNDPTDYCAGYTPREFLDEVIEKVIREKGYTAVRDNLLQIVNQPCGIANALELSTACVNAWEGK